MAVIVLEGTLKVGDKVKITRNEESFEETVGSMQINHQEVASATRGQEVAIKLSPAHQRRSDGVQSPDMDLSVVTVTWNAEKNIAGQLRSVILACGKISFEQIVVDNASDDNTVAVIKVCHSFTEEGLGVA